MEALSSAQSATRTATQYAGPSPLTVLVGTVALIVFVAILTDDSPSGQGFFRHAYKKVDKFADIVKGPEECERYIRHLAVAKSTETLGRLRLRAPELNQSIIGAAEQLSERLQADIAAQRLEWDANVCIGLLDELIAGTPEPRANAPLSAALRQDLTRALDSLDLDSSETIDAVNAALGALRAEADAQAELGIKQGLDAAEHLRRLRLQVERRVADLSRGKPTPEPVELRPRPNKVVGMSNPGSTCYLASALQSILAMGLDGYFDPERALPVPMILDRCTVRPQLTEEAQALRAVVVNRMHQILQSARAGEAISAHDMGELQMDCYHYFSYGAEGRAGLYGGRPRSYQDARAFIERLLELVGCEKFQSYQLAAYEKGETVNDLVVKAVDALPHQVYLSFQHPNHCPEEVEFFNDPKDPEHFRYRAVAVATGGLGHWTCHVRDQEGGWHYANDGSIKANEAESFKPHQPRGAWYIREPKPDV